MTETRQRLSRRAGMIALAAVAGVLAGTSAVYFMRSGDGNSAATAANCAGALAAAERAGPFATGKLAAFRVADAADSLTGLAFRASDGADTTLAAFAGKTTLVNLWATWCVPCRAEMPALDRLQTAIGGKDFQVVAINIDVGGAERARDFLTEIGVKDLAFYSDPSSSVFRTLKGRGLAFGLPTTVLVDGNGCRIGVVEGPAEWDSDEAKALIGAAMKSG